MKKVHCYFICANYFQELNAIHFPSRKPVKRALRQYLSWQLSTQKKYSKHSASYAQQVVPGPRRQVQTFSRGPRFGGFGPRGSRLWGGGAGGRRLDAVAFPGLMGPSRIFFSCTVYFNGFQDFTSCLETVKAWKSQATSSL